MLTCLDRNSIMMIILLDPYLAAAIILESVFTHLNIMYKC